MATPRPPKGRTRVAYVNFRITATPELKAAVTARAAAEDVSVQSLVRRYLQEGIDNDADK